MRFRFGLALSMLAALCFTAPLAHAAPMHVHEVISSVVSHAPPVHIAPQITPWVEDTFRAPVIATLDFSNLLTTGNVSWAIGAILSFLLGLGGVSKWLTVSRRKWIGFAAHHAFLVVEDAQSNGLVKFDNKVLAGLQAADDWLAANGFRTLSPQEQAAVKLEFKALNGSTVLAASPSQPAAK